MWNLFHQVSRHSYEQRIFSVVIQTNVEHLCYDQKVSPESEAIIYLEDIALVSFSSIDYL